MKLESGLDMTLFIVLCFLSAWKLFDVGMWLHANGMLYIAGLP
jgi:hypothetical protein